MTPDILNRAADIMSARGKADTAYIDDDGSCCLVGAIWIAMHPEIAGGKCVGDVSAISRFLARHDPVFHVTNMRNTKDESVATLRALAATEKARAQRLLPVISEQVHA